MAKKILVVVDAQYDLKVLEISSNKLVLEFHDKDETSEHYAKMTYKRG